MKNRAVADAASLPHLYGLTRDELHYILNPKDVFVVEFPSETSRVLKESGPVSAFDVPPLISPSVVAAGC